MTSLALAHTNEQVIENKVKTGFSITSLFSKLSQAPAIAKSVAQSLKQETALSFDAMFRTNRLDEETITAQRAKLKDMAAHAGIMMLAKSLVAFTIGTGSIVPIAATVAVSTAAVSAYKIAQQALKDRKAGENSFWGSVKNAFTSGSALSTLKTQFKRAALGGAFGFGFHELLSNIDWSALNPVGTAHAATPAGAIIGSAKPDAANTLDQVRAHLEATGKTSRSAGIDLAGAVNGNAQDTKDMAWRLYNGVGVVKNQELAFKLYDQAAEMGNRQAQRDLAYFARIGVYDPQGSEATAALNRAEFERTRVFATDPQASTEPVATNSTTKAGPTILTIDPSILDDDTVTSAPITSETTLESGPAIETAIAEETAPEEATSEPENLLPPEFTNDASGPLIPTTDTDPTPSDAATSENAPSEIVYNDIATCEATPVTVQEGSVRANKFMFNCVDNIKPDTLVKPGDSILIQLRGVFTRMAYSGEQPANAMRWIQRDAWPTFTALNRDVALSMLQPQNAGSGPSISGFR